MQTLLVLLLLASLAAALLLLVRLRSERGRARTAEAKARTLQSALDRLSRYERVADADEEATRLLREAEAEADRLRREAETLIARAAEEREALMSSATAQAAAVLSEAKERARTSGQQADAIVAAAQARAEQVLREAEARAADVAGEALVAMRNAEQWERTARAMQNVVKGYGDEYVIPTHTLLDGLAESFGHTEAGQQLTLIRSQIRQAVKEGRAATCDYVEENRRTTAVRFVIDAFNGKADSILTRIKQDNSGKLQQELRDAFALVNVNGQAFRNAQITDGYLGLRLEELRWASILEALRLEQREEQRRIKERIREEERARRDYERAMREAAKEEDAVRKAMEKAQAQLAKATEEQRASFEAQLQELAARLAEAESKNQRALSMAQQTRRGHVYVISNVGSLGEDVFKIGLTRRLDPHDRVRELGDSSVPFDFDVHAMIFSDDAPALEHRLHKHFVMSQVNKVNHRKEFFRATLAHIKAEVDALGLATQWTLTAEARQYRETLAIERVIREDPAAAEVWARRQLVLEDADDPFVSDGAEPGEPPSLHDVLEEAV